MHNLLLLISLAGNKAYFQPTVNNSDSSPSYFHTMLHSPSGDPIYSVVWRRLPATLLNEGKCALSIFKALLTKTGRAFSKQAPEH